MLCTPLGEKCVVLFVSSSHHKLVEADTPVEVFVELIDHCLQLAVSEAIISELLRHSLEVLDGDLQVNRPNQQQQTHVPALLCLACTFSHPCNRKYVAPWRKYVFADLRLCRCLRISVLSWSLPLFSLIGAKTERSSQASSVRHAKK